MRKVLNVLCVAFLLFVISVTAATFNTYWNTGDFTVPPDPLAHREQSKEELDAWEHALKQCLPISRFEILENEECLEALQKYFLNEPVWASSMLNYYDRSKGLQPLPVKLINSRPQVLPYSHADFLTNDIPFWRDIFDGKLHRTISRFRQVILDDACMELSKQTSVGIQPELAKQCAAREMFKYATFLDACNVAMQRTMILVNIPAYSGVLSGMDSSVYDLAQEIIQEKIEGSAKREQAQKRLEKGFLRAVWLHYECSPWGYALLPDIETTPPPDERTTRLWTVSLDRMHQRINRTHDTIHKIAAKSGDSWAIQSFPMGIFTSHEFNDDVQQHYPLLMHRHLGSPTGWFRSELTSAERAQHQAKAFLILEDSVGEKDAHFEYDPTELEHELEHVSNGGALKYPRPLAEIMQAREERFDKEEDLILKESGFKAP